MTPQNLFKNFTCGIFVDYLDIREKEIEIEAHEAGKSSGGTEA